MKNKLLISINLLVVVLEIIATTLSVKEFDYKFLTYYTQYSNVLALISSLFLVAFLLKKRVKTKITIKIKSIKY